VINGPLDADIEHRAPNNVNISIKEQESEYLAIALSKRGIACGTRSACIGEGGGPSYVLQAMGRNEYASSMLRFTFGRASTKEHVDKLIEELLSVLTNFDNT
jgi:cysteine sulfinate desulfinase/cysteine desulfurase-like protein